MSDMNGCNIPDEWDWKEKMDELNKRTEDFNINHYIHVMSEEEKTFYLKIVKKVPEDKIIYM
jgi:hypothetical protein